MNKEKIFYKMKGLSFEYDKIKLKQTQTMMQPL